MAEVEDPVIPTDLHPCSICSRTFIAESLEKHYKHCEKNATKKRKIFDSTRQRVEGTDLANYLPIILKSKKLTEKLPVKKSQSEWKVQHMEFVRAIRAARGVVETREGEEASMTAITRPQNHEQCDTCERYFGPKAYERHIEWCKEKQARLPRKANVSSDTIIAKERLEARTKYRAPSLVKSRRETTRDKYSGSRSGGGDSCSKQSVQETGNASSFQRTPQRSSVRQSSSSPVKRGTTCSHIVERKDPTRTRGVSPQKGIRESPPRAVKRSEVSPTTRAKVVSSAPRRKPEVGPQTNNTSNRNRAPVDLYDPFLTAKRQLMDLLANDSPCSETSTLSPQTSSPLIPSVLETSPTSAFSKYSSSSSTEVEAQVDDEEDIISGHAAKLFSSKASSIADSIENYSNIRDIAASLSSLSICSLEDLNLQNKGIMNNSTGRGNRRNLKYRKKLENAAISLRRSVSLFHPGDSNDNVDSDNQNAENKGNSPNSAYPNPSFSLSSLGSLTSLHRMQSSETDELTEVRAEALKVKSSRLRRQASETSSPEENLSVKNKFNHDSAYSSLNRKSPMQTANGRHTERLPLSSSSSESSIPSLTYKQSLRRGGSSPTHALHLRPTQKMSNFCHECGSKFPLSVAKFCCECGVKRLAI